MSSVTKRNGIRIINIQLSTFNYQHSIINIQTMARQRHKLSREEQLLWRRARRAAKKPDPVVDWFQQPDGKPLAYDVRVLVHRHKELSPKKGARQILSTAEFKEHHLAFAAAGHASDDLLDSALRYADFFSHARTLMDAIKDAITMIRNGMSQADTTCSDQDHEHDVQEVLSTLNKKGDITLADTLRKLAAYPPKQGAEGFRKSEFFKRYAQHDSSWRWCSMNASAPVRIELYVRCFSSASTFVEAVRECIEKIPLGQ